MSAVTKRDDAPAPRLAVVGALGRMGQAVVRLAAEEGLELAAAFDAKGAGQDVGEVAGLGARGVPVQRDLGALTAARVDVLVDFSLPQATPDVALACAAAKVALVSGTTGLGEPETSALDRSAAVVPVLWEPNMSVGVHVLSALVARAVELLGEDFDVEITETHHRAKVDAPSGTALRLAEVAQKARAELALVHGRQGKVGARKPSELGMHALRGGDVVGDHTVFLFGQGERLELTHRASSRDLFARGALRAARWIAGRAPGRYGLRDVVGL